MRREEQSIEDETFGKEGTEGFGPDFAFLLIGRGVGTTAINKQ